MNNHNSIPSSVQPDSDFATEQLAEMPDARLFRLCQQYGYAVLDARRKFAGLLPEVLRRGLYERKGFSSIFEFAAKLAGMSREQVDMVLRLEKRFENMPVLHTALVQGEVSMNKLVRVVSIATPENQEELMEKVKMLSKRALEVLVRDEKYGAEYPFEDGYSEYQNGLFTIKNEPKSLPGHSKISSFDKGVQLGQSLLLDEDVEKELLEMQQKGININELLRGFLQKRKLELANEKEELSREQEGNRRAAVLGKTEANRAMVTQDKIGNGQQQLTQKKPSRYIPAKIRHYLQQEYGTKCAKPACYKTAENIHHTARWSLSHNHDPRYLAPLCKEHHQIAHSIDGRYHHYRRAHAGVG